VDVHVHAHLHDDDLPAMVQQVLQQQGVLMTALERLTEEVEQSRTVAESAKALIVGLAEQLRQASTDPAAINTLADRLDAQQALLAAAIEANQVPVSQPPAPPVDPNPQV